MLSVVYLIVGIIAFSYLLIKKRYSFWRDRGFEGPLGVFPFGSMKGVGTKITQAEGFDEIYKQFKGKAQAIGIYSFLAPSIMLIDPEMFKNVLVRDFSSFVNRSFYYNKEDDPTSAKY